MLTAACDANQMQRESNATTLFHALTVYACANPDVVSLIVAVDADALFAKLS